MKISPISNINYKSKNSNYNQKEKLFTKDVSDLLLPIGILCNFNYLTDFSHGTKYEKFGKVAIWSPLVIDSIYSWFNSKQKNKGGKNDPENSSTK